MLFVYLHSSLFGLNHFAAYKIGKTSQLVRQCIKLLTCPCRYTSRNMTRQASIIEGLHSASIFFSQLDKIAAKRTAAAASIVSTNGNGNGANSCKKLVILVTQSAPLHHPWTPASLEQTLKNLKLNNIKLSVLGCHKIGELYRIFETTGGDLNAATHKNYTTRPQHLVLLSGFSLPEHDNPPIAQHPSNSTATNITAQTANSNPSLQQQQQQSPAASANAINPSPQQQVATNVTSVAAVGSPASQQQQQQQQHSLPPPLARSNSVR